MNKLCFCLVTLLWTACVAHAAHRSVHDVASDDSAPAQFVKDFYTSFDAPGRPALESFFAPSAKIIHQDGLATDIAQMRSILAKTVWVPRKRELSGFETLRIGNVVIVGCLNHVVHQRDGSAPHENTFNETWVLERTTGGFRAVRVHYSLVSRREHTE